MFGLGASLVGAAPASTGLRVGTAAIDITPDVFPIQLRSGKSDHVHDPLHVRAVAFENGEGRAVIALIDAIGYGRERADEAKALVAKETGWRPEEMLVCATHTHTAPKGGDTSPGRIAYEEKRFQGIVRALAGAIGSLQPAEVGHARDAEPGEVYNRRWLLKPGVVMLHPLGKKDKVRTNGPRDKILKPAGPTDPDLCVVLARTRTGRPLGLVANYALHYVGGVPQVPEKGGRLVGMASADYYGEFARLMPSRMRNPADNFVAFMSNGSSGDINNIDFYGTRPPRAPFEQIQVVAQKTADAAWRAVQKIRQYDRNPVIAMRQREVAIRYREPGAEDVALAEKVLQLPRKEREAINKRSTSVANNTVAFAREDAPKTEKVLVQALRIGDQAIVTMPFEVLVEIGLEIKARSPFPDTFMIELANGGYGYLPPPHQHDLGGYETWLGTSRFARDTSVVLTGHLLEMLAELKAL
jgi:neutral ceramidase